MKIRQIMFRMILIIITTSIAFVIYSAEKSAENMVILGHTLSPETSTFVSEQMGKINKKFVFKNIEEHPFESHRNLNGIHEANETTEIIWINLLGSHFEYTIAHEIMHSVLDAEGFPTTSRTQKYANDEWTAYVGSSLQSVILDAVIDNRLLNHNIIDPDKSNVIQQKIEKLEQSKLEPSEYGPSFDLWALDCLHTEIDPTLDYTEKERLKSEIGRVFPRVESVGNDLIKAVNSTGFRNPDQALNAMINIRDLLKLQERCIIIDKVGRLY